MNKKFKIFYEYFLLVLFIAYYLNITSFYHTHVINGKEITHSHFYKTVNNTKSTPVKHTHSQNELFAIHIISQFITTVASGYLILKATQFLLNELLVPLNESVCELIPLFGYSLRGPPAK